MKEEVGELLTGFLRSLEILAGQQEVLYRINTH